MKEIIAKSQALYETLLSKNAALDKEKALVSTKTEELTALQKNYDAKAQDLSAREAEIKPIEDLVALKASASTAKKEAEEALKALRTETIEADSAATEAKKKAVADKAEIANKRALCAKEYDKLHEDQAKLVEERKDLKAKLMKELAAKIGA